MIFAKLILAHLIGDFILQPDAWVTAKEKRKAASPYLYLHVMLHALLSFIFLWDTKLWWASAAVGLSHLIIDLGKLYFQKPANKRQWFFADQLLHVAVIALIAAKLGDFDMKLLRDAAVVKAIAGAVFLTSPVSMMIKMLLSSWSPVTVDQSKLQTESLVNAGKYIGILERLMVFTFIFVNHWEGVGFMVAAKSVFRFSDLAEAKQRKLTEYVLIGTLLSFGIAVLTGILVKI